MALTFLSILHIIFIVALITLVLLQDSKGGAMGMFGGGGGSSNVFGGAGGSNFLVSATKWVSIFFAISCLSLVWLTNQSADSVMDNYVPTQQTESMDTGAGGMESGGAEQQATDKPADTPEN